MLKLENISKKYIYNNQKTVIFNNVNIVFPDTGLVFINGVSGKGKTTLLNLIGLLDNFDSGEIYLDNFKYSSLTNDDKFKIRNGLISIVFQEDNLINDLSVYDNLILFNKDICDNEIDEILSLLDLSEYKYKKVNELSGGEYQRVSVARCLIKKSKIILLDEPTGALDFKRSSVLMEYIKKISSDHLVIMVSHDKKLVSNYCDYTIDLNKDMNYDFKGSKTYEVSKNNISNNVLYKIGLNNLIKRPFQTILSLLFFIISFICLLFMFEYAFINKTKLCLNKCYENNEILYTIDEEDISKMDSNNVRSCYKTDDYSFRFIEIDDRLEEILKDNIRGNLPSNYNEIIVNENYKEYYSNDFKVVGYVNSYLFDGIKNCVFVKKGFIENVEVPLFNNGTPKNFELIYNIDNHSYSKIETRGSNITLKRIACYRGMDAINYIDLEGNIRSDISKDGVIIPEYVFGYNLNNTFTNYINSLINDYCSTYELTDDDKTLLRSYFRYDIGEYRLKKYYATYIKEVDINEIDSSHSINYFNKIAIDYFLKEYNKVYIKSDLINKSYNIIGIIPSSNYETYNNLYVSNDIYTEINNEMRSLDFSVKNGIVLLTNDYKQDKKDFNKIIDKVDFLSENNRRNKCTNFTLKALNDSTSGSIRYYYQIIHKYYLPIILINMLFILIYFLDIFVYRIHDIGICYSQGINKKEVISTFMFQSLIYFVFSFMICFITICILNGYLNNEINTNYNIKYLFSFNILTLLASLVTILLFFVISIIIPFLFIIKKEPIKLIKRNL